MVGTMSTALVIASTPAGKEMIRSDMVAAKVLQNAIKEGRGEEVLGGKAGDARPESAARTETKRIDALENRPDAKGPETDQGSAPLNRSAQFTAMREKIGDMTRALAGLKEAFEAMGGYQSMIMESDSATAIAFAGNVLGNVERDADARGEKADAGKRGREEVNTLRGSEGADFIVADAGIVNRVESGDGDDAIVARGGIVRHISGGEGSDGIALQAGRAVDVSGGAGDDAIGVEAVTAWGVSAGAGDDTMQVSGARVSAISGGSGDDTMSVQGRRVRDIEAGSGDDRMSIVGKRISGVSDGAGNDVVTVVGGRLTGLESSEGDDVYNLNVGSAKMSLKQGMGIDVVNLSNGTHMQFVISDPSMMETGAVSALWDGDNLALSFKNGDSLIINNAANAGSISMRSEGTVLTLMAPKIPAGEGILDIAV